MFSSSVAGGSICLGCQLRAVTRRVAAPIGSTAAQTRIRHRKRRFHASRASKSHQDDAFAILQKLKNEESKKSLGRTDHDDWGLAEDKTQDTNNGLGREYEHTFQDPAEPMRQDDFIQEALGNQPHSDDTSEAFHGEAESTQQGDGPEKQTVRRVAEGIDWAASFRPNRYWKGGTQLVEDFRKLTVDTLGREAEIIVLKDAGRYRTRMPAELDEASFRERPDLDELVDQDPGLSMDDIMENIGSFRPDICLLPAREFKVLFDKLMSAFTTPQLAEYVTRYMERVAQGKETPFTGSLPGSWSSRPWIVSEMRWIPEVQGAVPHVGRTLQGYILKSMSFKQRRVMEIMRQCWGMSVQELTSGSGTLEITIRDLEFKLLTLGTQRWLQSITRVHLGHGKGKAISVVKSRNILRIEAPRAIAISCLDAIDSTLSKTHSKTFSMDVATFANLDVGVVEELGELTTSVLRLDKKRHEIEVTWLDYMERSASKLEDLGDTVFRLLLTGNPHSNAGHSLKVYPHVPGQARLVEELGSPEKRSWMHRRMRWARVYLPVSTRSTVLEEAWTSDDGVLEYEVVSTPQDFVLPRAKPGAKEFGSTTLVKWSEIGGVVANRKGAKASPLALPWQGRVPTIPTEEEQNKGSREPDPIKALLEANTSVEEQAEPESQETEKLETSSALDKPEGKQVPTSGSQATEEPQVVEEPQSSTESGIPEEERAELQEPQAEELKASEDAEPAVDPVSTPEESLEEKESESEAPEEQKLPTQSHWSPFRVTTNAVFGHVLHLFQPDGTHSVNKAVATIEGLAESPRTISPVIPPVSKMDLKGWVPYNIPSNMSSMILMRFVPSNDNDVDTADIADTANTADTADAAEKRQRKQRKKQKLRKLQTTNPAPLLELRMKASDEDIIEIDSLRAVSRTHVSDLLFPGEAVDVRATQRLEAVLPGPMVRTMDGMDPLVTFLTNSHLAVQEGKLLTPPRIEKLGLPEWVFRDHPDELAAHQKNLAASKSSFSSAASSSPSSSESANKKTHKKKKQAKQGKEGGDAAEEAAPLRPTSYVFAGLEVHRTLETVYDGWRLAYTSVEAGQGGGRRAELSLEARPGYDEDLRRPAEQINAHEFLRSVHNLVRGLPGRLVQTRKRDNERIRTTIEWLGAGKKGM